MIGDRIKSTRKSLRMTQKDLAAAIRVTQTAVSKWESNTDEPKGKNLDALAKTLKVSLEWVLYGGNNPQASGNQFQTVEPNTAKSGLEGVIERYRQMPLYDRANAAKHLNNQNPTAVKDISSIAIPENLYSDLVFAMTEDMGGFTPIINEGDRVFIKPELPIKHGTNSMFWVNGSPLIGRIAMTPTGMMLRFISTTQGWEPVKVTAEDYIGRVIAIDPIWAIEQREN